MTARPPRASTKGEGRRPRTRGATHGDKDRPDKRRQVSVMPTDQFERIGDDEIVEVAELAEVPQLRLLVLEAALHLASAQGAVVSAGHVVVIGASGTGGIEKLRYAVGDVDAILVGLPGGEPLIDVALAHARRPIVIAASTCGAVEAARRAAAAGADLATVRPHDVERLAPLLLAAARMVEHRRQLAGAGAAMARPLTDGGLGDVLDGLAEIDPGDELGDPLDAEPEHAGLVSVDQLQEVATRELERARHFGYPLALAMFSVEIAPPAPPAALRGILRARAGNALVHALRDIDLAAELDQDRFLVLMPYTERLAGAEVARRIIGAVAAGDPVVAGGRMFPPKVIGAVAGVASGEANAFLPRDAPRGAPVSIEQLVQDVTQLLEQAQVTGASLAVET